MSILPDLKKRFHSALAGMVDDPAEMVELVRRSQDPKFGDYQANMAMPLAKRLGRPPRDVAAEIVARLDVADLCASRKSPGRASSICGSATIGWSDGFRRPSAILGLALPRSPSRAPS